MRGEAPWGNAVRRYLDHKDRRGISAGRIRVERHVLLRLTRYCQIEGLRDPQSISPQEIQKFVRYLQTTYRCRRPRQGQRLSEAAVHDTIVVVRQLLRFLVREGDLLLDPTRFMKSGPRWQSSLVDRSARMDQIEPMTRGRPRPDDLCAVRNRTLLEVLFGCGLRCGELVALNMDDVDLDKGVVCVRRSKNGDGRLVPIAGVAHQWLGEYRDIVRPQLVTRESGRALFLTVRGRRLATYTVSVVIKRLSRKAGLRTRLTPHMFRHGYATAILRGGADVRSVQVLLGHRRIDSTQRYTVVGLEDLRKVHARTHPRERIRQ